MLTHNLRCLLGKGGVAAPSRNIAKHPLMGADGVVGSISPQILMVREVVDRTTPSARNEVASQYLFERAATPPLPRRGVCLRSALGNSPSPPGANGISPLRGCRDTAPPVLASLQQ